LTLKTVAIVRAALPFGAVLMLVYFALMSLLVQ